MWTKAQVINFAFRKTGIASGTVTSPASADMVSDALIDYEALVNEYAAQMNIRPYVTNPPDLNDYTGLSDLGSQAMGYQLGLRLLPEYLMEPTPQYSAVAAQTLENFRTSVFEVPILERRYDMPVGAGWKMRTGWGEFYQQANIVAGSQVMAVNDVGTYTVNFDQGQLLPNEFIASFQQKHSEYAEIISATFDVNVITYTVKFTEPGSGWVAFTVAGDQNTVTTMRVNFDVRSVE